MIAALKTIFAVCARLVSRFSDCPCSEWNDLPYEERHATRARIDRPLYCYSNLLVQGTYGGHLEISAFAHMKRKNVKVIQPGLVYVIEWDAGSPFPSSPPDEEQDVAPPTPEAERNHRRARRDKKRASVDPEASSEQAAGPSSAPSGANTVYIA